MATSNPFGDFGRALSSDAAGGLSELLSIPFKLASFAGAGGLAQHSIDRFAQLGDPSLNPATSLDEILGRLGGAQAQEFGNRQDTRQQQQGIVGGRVDRLQSGRTEQLDLFDETIANPNILSQRAIDQLVAKSIEQNNAATEAQFRALEDRAASTGQAGSGLAESRRKAGEANQSANSIAGRDAELLNALNSAQRQDAATRERGQFLLGIEQLLGGAEGAQADLAGELSFQSLIDRDFAGREAARQESREAVAFLINLLSDTGGELSQRSQDILGRNRELQAAEDAQPSGFNEIFGGVTQAAATILPLVL